MKRKLRLPVEESDRSCELPPTHLVDSEDVPLWLDQSTVACERGDAKTVRQLIQGEASLKLSIAMKQRLLGAAIWGMHPTIVETVLVLIGSTTHFPWIQCVRYNRQHYEGQIFKNQEFAPKTYGQWYLELEKLELSSLLKADHLREYNAVYQAGRPRPYSWHDLKEDVGETLPSLYCALKAFEILSKTELHFAVYRNKIRQLVSTAYPAPTTTPIKSLSIPLATAEQDREKKRQRQGVKEKQHQLEIKQLEDQIVPLQSVLNNTRKEPALLMDRMPLAGSRYSIFPSGVKSMDFLPPINLTKEPDYELLTAGNYFTSENS